MTEVSRTDHQIIEAIERVFATEQDDAAAVRKVRQILAPVVPTEGLPDYNPETATESERWAYDQGHEAGWQARLDATEMDMDECIEVMRVVLAVLERMTAEKEAAKESKSRGRIEFEGAVVELPDEGPQR